MKQSLAIIALAMLMGCSKEPPPQNEKQSATDAKKIESMGYLAEDKVKMTIKDVQVLWIKKESKLQILLFPFKLNDADLEKAAKGSAFMLAFDKPSPDESIWKWCPVGELSITLVEQGRNASPESVDFMYVMAYGLGEKNHTANINKSGDNIGTEFFKKLKLDLSSEKPSVSLESKGTDDNMKKKYSWHVVLNKQPVVIK